MKWIDKIYMHFNITISTNSPQISFVSCLNSNRIFIYFFLVQSATKKSSLGTEWNRLERCRLLSSLRMASSVTPCCSNFKWARMCGSTSSSSTETHTVSTLVGNKLKSCTYLNLASFLQNTLILQDSYKTS